MDSKDKQDEVYWMQKFREGENAALAFFFDLHFKSLCFFATRLANDTFQAEDIVTDCFLKLWERRQDFDTAQNLKAFLYISCRNASLNYLTVQKRGNSAREIYVNQFDYIEESVLNQIIKTEVLAALDLEIQHLPDRCGEIFKLIYFEGKKTDDIARELNLSVQTVRNQKTRAIELLRSAILKKGISGAFYLAFMLLVYGK